MVNRARQNERYDAIILEAIRSNEFKVDPETGQLFKETNIGLKSMGGFNNYIQQITVTLYEKGKTRAVLLCRYIYLFVHKQIPKNHIVCHADGNSRNNIISNLILKEYDPARFNNRWLAEDDEKLKSMFNKYSWPTIAETLNRSVHAVRNRATVLGIFKTKSKEFKKWTRADEMQLEKLHKSGKTIKEISTSLNRTELSVQKRGLKCFGFYSRPHRYKEDIKGNFYANLKNYLVHGTAQSKCCICGYDRHLDLHHIDGNRKNNEKYNIASLCPNHHREVEAKEQEGVPLFTIWRRYIPTHYIGPWKDNKKEINDRKK